MLKSYTPTGAKGTPAFSPYIVERGSVEKKVSSTIRPVKREGIGVSVNSSKTDAGIIYVPDPADKKKTQPVAVCVLTDGNDDKRWVADNAAQVLIATVGKEVYGYFAK